MLSGYFVTVYLSKFIITIICLYPMMISKRNINAHVYLDRVHHSWDLFQNYQSHVSDKQLFFIFSVSSGVISIHPMTLDHLKLIVSVWLLKILTYEGIYLVWMGMNIPSVKKYHYILCLILYFLLLCDALWVLSCCCSTIYMSKSI